MDAADLEGIAADAYREAGADPGGAESPVVIARALLGSGAIEIVPPGALRHSVAALARVGDAWRIYVRRGSREAMGFAVSHELGHWLLRRAGAAGTEDEERDADMIAGAIVAPRRAFLAALRAMGRDLPELAESFGTTESLVALRYGESTGVPTALVRPGLVRVRSQLEFVWPEESTIRRWASGTPPRGLAKTRLRDDPQRVVLTGEDIGSA